MLVFRIAMSKEQDGDVKAAVPSISVAMSAKKSKEWMLVNLKYLILSNEVRKREATYLTLSPHHLSERKDKTDRINKSESFRGVKNLVHIS